MTFQRQTNSVLPQRFVSISRYSIHFQENFDEHLNSILSCPMFPDISQIRKENTGFKHIYHRVLYINQERRVKTMPGQ